jgi:hypothetical protein
MAAHARGGRRLAPDGRPEQDAVVMVEGVTEEFDRAWWRR